MWSNLKSWVEQNGGFVHKSLELRMIQPRPDTGTDQRGLFVSANVPTMRSDEILIRLPRSTATMNGQCMPSSYDDSSNSETVTVAVSPWLRCIAALMLAMDQCNGGKKARKDFDVQVELPKTDQHDVTPYIASLPTSYETIWQWSTQEIEEYLAGTTPAGLDVGPTPSNAWMIDPLVVRSRYNTTIRPYLRQCGAISMAHHDHKNELRDFNRFKIACQILSTRGFFMDHDSAQQSPMERLSEEDPTGLYTGPYLLPVIDLINHADSQHGSVGGINAQLELRHTPDDAFIIRATKDIAPDTEILHSYGDHLSSYQFLLSFGFVPWSRIERALTLNSSRNITDDTFLGSVVISKQDIWESCWQVIESGLPSKLSTIIDQSFGEDETWDVLVDRSRTADSVPDHIEITQTARDNNGAVVQPFPPSLLSDELVTAACVPFLPSDAYAEMTASTLLDRTILHDYFLGQLVGTAILRTIQRRLSLYLPIPHATVQRWIPTFPNPACDAAKTTDDVPLLKSMLSLCSNDDITKASTFDVCRLLYGLTIRLEEKATLEALSQLVAMELLENLDTDVAIGGEDDTSSKKRKTTME